MTDELRKKHSDRLKSNPPDPLGQRLPVQKGSLGSNHQTAKAILQIDKVSGVTISKYNSLTDAVNENNFKYANISMCLTSKNQSAYGFKWKYDEK